MPHRLANVAITMPLDLLKRLVGAAAGIAPDREAIELARAEIAQVEAMLASSMETSRRERA